MESSVLSLPLTHNNTSKRQSITPLHTPYTYLVRHVPNDAVVGRVEHIVEGDGQLDHAQRGAQVAPRLGHVAERVPPQLLRQLPELLLLGMVGMGCEATVARSWGVPSQ